MGTKKKDGAVVAGKGANAQPDTEALAVIDNDDGGQVSCVHPETMALGECDGEFDQVHLRLPYLQIGHAQGKLEAFRKGSVVLGADNLIAEPGAPIHLTILASRVYWKEYVGGSDYDPDYIPKTFATQKEVVAAGGTTQWVANKPPTYKIAVASKVLIKQPEGVICGLFGLALGGPEIDGEGAELSNWAPAMWNVDKTAASKVAPIIKTDRMFSLKRRGMAAGIYEFTSKLEKFSSGFSAYVPVIRLVDYHSDAVLEQIKAVCGGADQDPDLPGTDEG